MGYDQNRSLIIGQIRFQPADRAYVQMVRRFVKQHKIRFLQKELCERRTGFLTARERLDALAEFAFRKAEAAQYTGDFPFVGVTVKISESRHQLIVFIQKL